jgi:hypothetical protein
VLPTVPGTVLTARTPKFGQGGGDRGLSFYGWIGHERDFLCTRQNLARRDRLGLFSIQKYGLLNRRPKEDRFLYREVTSVFV